MENSIWKLELLTHFVNVVLTDEDINHHIMSLRFGSTVISRRKVATIDIFLCGICGKQACVGKNPTFKSHNHKRALSNPNVYLQCTWRNQMHMCTFKGMYDCISCWKWVKLLRRGMHTVNIQLSDILKTCYSI